MLFINKLFNSIACLLYFINLQLVLPGRTWILLYLGRTVYKHLWVCLALYVILTLFQYFKYFIKYFIYHFQQCILTIFLSISNNAFFQIQMNFFSNESGESGEEDIYGTESLDKHTSVVMKIHMILNTQMQTLKDQDGKWFKFTCSNSVKDKAQRFLS